MPPAPAEQAAIPLLVPPQQLLNNRDGGGGTSSSTIQPLIPSGGITGEPYDGRHAVVWRLRLPKCVAAFPRPQRSLPSWHSSWKRRA